MTSVFLTKMKGKIPTMKVMVKEIARAARAESLPSATDTITERNMNSALTRSARPMFLLITFQFICVSP